MSIWKNTEVRRTALWLLLATAVCAVAAALLYPICGLLTLGLGAVCGAIWYASTRRRYRELERMSRDIDRILHGQEQQVLPQQEEGEHPAAAAQVADPPPGAYRGEAAQQQAVPPQGEAVRRLRQRIGTQLLHGQGSSPEI